MSLRLQPVRVATCSPDIAGQLAFAGDFLVAVLAQLSDEHESAIGMWFLEVGFGPVDTATPPTFADLDVEQGWIEQRLARAA